MEKVISAISVLIYLFFTVICLDSLGEPRNFAIFWIVPASIQLICYTILFIRKSASNKMFLVVTAFGFIIGISPILMFGESAFDVGFIFPFGLLIIISFVSFASLILKRKS